MSGLPGAAVFPETGLSRDKVVARTTPYSPDRLCSLLRFQAAMLGLFVRIRFGYMGHHLLQNGPDVRFVVLHRGFFGGEYLRGLPFLWLTLTLEVVPCMNDGDKRLNRGVKTDAPFHAYTWRELFQLGWLFAFSRSFIHT